MRIWPQPALAGLFPLTPRDRTSKIVQSALRAVQIRTPAAAPPRGCARTVRSCSRPQTTARGTPVPMIEENR
ncbi:hypothetical protein [Brachybacterium sacelli]|uniref:hypothetical protein n=1 Tax=Brachybacterium sacelli TaxID=173364 RepID=UPI0036122737